MNGDTYHLRRLRRLKWRVVGLAVVLVTAIELFDYFIREVPFVDNSIDWLLGITVAVVLIEIGFRASAKLQRQLQNEITHRRRAEEALREREQTISALVETSTDWIWAIDLEGRHTYCNPATEAILGYQPDELIGRSSLDFIHADDREEIETELPRWIEEKRGWNNRLLRWRHKDGRYRYLESNAVPILDSDGELTGFRGVDRDVSERMKAEEALARFETEWTYAMDSFEDAIYLIDTDDKVIRANRAFARLTGLSSEQAVGQDITSLIHPDGERNVCPVCLARRERRDAIITMEAEHPDNPTGLPVEVMVRMIRNQADEVVGVLMGIHDLTRYRETEKAVRESEERYRELANSLPEVIYETDVAGNLTFINKTAADILGYTVADFDGDRTAADVLAPEDRERGKKNIQRTLRGVQGGSIEYTILRKDGTRVPVLIHAHPILSGSQYVGTRGVIVDLTERKRAEDALRKSEALYRKAIEVAGAVPYYQSYVTNTYEFVGEGIQALVGCRPEEFDYEFWQSISEEVVLAGDLADMPPEQAVERAKSREGVSWRADYRVRTRQGEERWIANAAVQVRDESGEIVGSLGILQDITEQRKAERETRRLEEQLRQSQKMEAVGQLAGGIAHDFNNLLQAILGYTDMAMLAVPPGDRIYEDLGQVRKAAERAATLTSQLLAFGRRQMLQPENLNLNQLVSELMEILQRVIGEHIELGLVRGDSLETIHADSGMLQQVLVNLCVNARDAMPDGGRLTIETRNQAIDESFCETHAWAKPGNYVLLVVTDTGLGMSPDVLKRIFEPFFTTKEVGQGSGLGLSMVYGIVKQHDGLTHVHSGEDHGATFEIYLPSVGKAIETTETDDGTSLAVEGGREVILLAEDEEVVREVALRILEKNGYRVLVARDGEEALQVFEAHKDDIQCAVLDVVMPRVSGKDVRDRIRAYRPDLPVIFCSGYGPNSAQTGFVLEEGAELIQKPYSQSVLLQRVREVLDAQG